MKSPDRLRTFKIVFYSIFGIYHLAILIASLIINEEWVISNLNRVFDLLTYLNKLKYIGMFGILLFLVDFIIGFVVASPYKKKSKKLEAEITQLKAKLYDKKENQSTPSTREESASSDDTSSQP